MSSPWDQPAPEKACAQRPNAAGLSRQDMAALMQRFGEPGFRATQVFEGLYRHRWQRWGDFTNLPKALRERLESEVELRWPDLAESIPSSDGSTKHAFRLDDGRLVEGVHMPYDDRATLCLSSQVGCAMGCTFCATGTMGILRNLTAAEIVGQVMALLLAHEHPFGKPVNLVFMGMGEPLHNLDHVMEAFRILTDAKGLAIPSRRITVSTSGLVSGIEKLGREAKRPRLAVSLNGTTDEERSRLMPVNRVWNLEALRRALQGFPLEKGERITLEYVLIQGHTDRPDDARRLAAYAKGFPSKINLIPYNPSEGAGFTPALESAIDAFCRLLVNERLDVSVRRSRGQDVAGACGQLVRTARR